MVEAVAVSHLRLNLQLLFVRAGWPALAGLLLLGIGAAMHTWWLPKQQERLVRMETEYRRLIAEFVKPVVVQPRQTQSALLAERHAAFNATLAPKSALPDLIKSVFSEAGKAGLTLAQAEYRTAEDKAGGYTSYQMVLPVRGPYLKLREFVAGVLAANPAAALEEVSFRRDGIGNPTTEARLRFVFYIKDAGT